MQATQEIRVRSLGQVDLLDKEMANHSSVIFLFSFSFRGVEKNLYYAFVTYLF